MGIETNPQYIASKPERKELKGKRDKLKEEIQQLMKPHTNYMPLFVQYFYIDKNMKSTIRNTWNGAICNKRVVEMMEELKSKLQK